jgi:hypothetical protein
MPHYLGEVCLRPKLDDNDRAGRKLGVSCLFSGWQQAGRSGSERRSGLHLDERRSHLDVEQPVR